MGEREGLYIGLVGGKEGRGKSSILGVYNSWGMKNIKWNMKR